MTCHPIASAERIVLFSFFTVLDWSLFRNQIDHSIDDVEETMVVLMPMARELSHHYLSMRNDEISHQAIKPCGTSMWYVVDGLFYSFLWGSWTTIFFLFFLRESVCVTVPGKWGKLINSPAIFSVVLY